MTKSILTKNQKQLLHILFSNPNISNNFYLSGGTALAEYYLRHRYSEDLDFFTDTEIDPMAIQIILKSIAKSLGIKKIDFEQSFNRNLFHLLFADETIKTEFTYYPFPQIERPKKVDTIEVDSLIDIAVNKTFTIYQKPRSRDFIDLYLILKEKHWQFSDLRKKTRIKFDTFMDPIQMAQQLLEVTSLKDYPHMITRLSAKTWQNFWIKEALKLKNEALA